jgi:hypothetical protein
MVQSSRLKKTLHPLFPLILFLILGTIFVFLFNKTFNEKVINTYSEYTLSRGEFIEEYNRIKGEINDKLLQKYTDINFYRLNLINSRELNSKLLSNLESLKALDTLSLKKYDNVDLNVVDDENRIAQSKELDKTIDLKIKSIDMYTIIKDFDNCLKTTKSPTLLSNCNYLYLKIAEPAIITNEYKAEVKSLFTTYNATSNTQRSKGINRIIPYHNKMIQNLEKNINSAISL